MRKLVGISILLMVIFITGKSNGDMSLNSSNVGRLTFSNQIRLVCAGDSITFGLRSTDSSGYRYALQRLLGIEDYFLVGHFNDGDESYLSNHHEGISGNTSTQLLARFQGIINYSYNSSVNTIFLIMIGTNDLSASVPIATITANIEDMIDLIVANDSGDDVYIGLVTPRSGALDADVTLLNTSISSMVSGYGKSNLYAVDLNSAFKDNTNWETELLDDGLHPNDLGYQVMADTWAAAIQANQ